MGAALDAEASSPSTLTLDEPPPLPPSALDSAVAVAVAFVAACADPSIINTTAATAQAYFFMIPRHSPVLRHAAPTGRRATTGLNSSGKLTLGWDGIYSTLLVII